MKSRKIVDHTNGYEPTLNEPWVMGDRPGCVRFDYESGREKVYSNLLMVGFGLLFFGTYGFEPKRYHHKSPLHSTLKMYLLIGTVLSGFAMAFLRGKRVFLQIITAIVCAVPFGFAIQLYRTHGASAIPEEYFFPTLVKIGFFMAVLSALQLFFTDDYLVIDPSRHLLIDHTQYLFIQREKPLTTLDRVTRVEVQERRATSKGVTTVYIKVALITEKQTFTCVHEASLGKSDNLAFNSEAEQVIALAVALAGATGNTVQYPPAITPARRRQP